MRSIDARTVVAGRAQGAVLHLTEPVSFWGGVDAETGAVIDVHHPQFGASLAGRIVVMTGGRGSSSSASVLAESIRLGTAPAALVLTHADTVLALGAIVAAELYGLAVPVVTIPGPTADTLADGDQMNVEAGEARARLEPAPG